MIVRLTGGLANQMFQYAFGQSLSVLHNAPVAYDWRRSTWDYGLDLYNTNVTLKTPTGTEIVYDEPCFNFDANAFNQPHGTYFRGYWQTAKYILEPEKIRQELTLKSVQPKVQELAKELQDCESVFLHIRRADYLNPGTEAYHGNLGHKTTGFDYYSHAIGEMKNRLTNPKFFVFSDDPDWCRANYPFVVLSGLYDRHEDLYLMSNCRHGIGANSTYSWWANWLGDRQDRISIAPKKWFNADVDTTDIIPQHWIRI